MPRSSLFETRKTGHTALPSHDARGRARWTLGLLLAPMLACDGPAPCRTCPAMQGHYGMSYELLQSEGTCPPAPLPQSLLIEQSGPTLRTQAGGTPLAGTLYGTLDFRLYGTLTTPEESLSIRIRGTLYPPSERADGGTQLRGIYSTTRLRPQANSQEACTAESSFIGDRL